MKNVHLLLAQSGYKNPHVKLHIDNFIFNFMKLKGCLLMISDHWANLITEPYVSLKPSGWKHGSHPKFLGPLGSTILPYVNEITCTL